MGKLNVGRRRFLRDLGISAGAVPLLGGLDSLYSKARAAAPPQKRFIVMYTENGVLYSGWRLPQAGASLNIADGTLLNNPNLIHQPLYKNASKLLIVDRVSYAAARNQYQVKSALKPPMTNTIDGLDHPGGHQKGMAAILTGQVLIGGAANFGSAGMGSGISVDQVIANNLFQGVSKFPSLQLAVRFGSDLDNLTDRYVDKRLSYALPVTPFTTSQVPTPGATPLAPLSDPFVLFRTLFGSGTAGGQAGTNLQLLMDKSVLDNVQGEFTGVKPKLSAADWQLLQQHQQAIRDIEGQLTNVIQVNCTTAIAPTAPPGLDITNPALTKAWTLLPSSYSVAGGMMINLMVQAVACGLTNVVTFMWGNSENDMDVSKFVPNFPGGSAGAHGMSHAQDPRLILVEQWYASQFNTMIDALSAVPESGGTGSVLDNSLLMYTSCLSDGAGHHSDNAPITLAGSNGGYFKTGQAIRLNNVFTPLPAPGSIQVAQKDQNTIGSPDHSNNDLLGSILDSFGLDVTKVAPSIADPRFFKGLLPGVKVGT